MMMMIKKAMEMIARISVETKRVEDWIWVAHTVSYPPTGPILSPRGQKKLWG